VSCGGELRAVLPSAVFIPRLRRREQGGAFLGEVGLKRRIVLDLLWPIVVDELSVRVDERTVRPVFGRSVAWGGCPPTVIA